MTNTCRIQNEFEWHIRGQIDLTNAAAVSANRGTNQAAAKTATGTYTVTVKGIEALKLVEILDQRVSFCNTVPAAATGCRISSITQTAGTDDIVITIKTSASPTTGADTDTTAATTLSYEVVLRTGKMGNPL